MTQFPDKWRPRAPWALLLAGGLAAVFGFLPPTGAAEAERQAVWRFDDGVFSGCQHNAFEGEVVPLPEGGYKRGNQGIMRTKGVLQGAGTTRHRMSAEFTLPALPAGPVALTVRGLDDPPPALNRLRVSLNDTVLGESAEWFANNDLSLTANARYHVGWRDIKLDLPAGALRAGVNRLVIENLSSALSSPHFNFVSLDYAELSFAEPVALTPPAPVYPPFYYGLEQGPEPHIWPANNLDNCLCLLTESDLEYNFFVTVPARIPAPDGTSVLAKDSEIMINIASPEPLLLRQVAGELVPGELREGRHHYRVRLARLVEHATPHPAQGARLFLRSPRAFEGQQLSVWCSIGERRFIQRDYALRAVSIPPLTERLANFQLSIWGGGVPAEPERQEEYVKFVRGVGFNHMFTGSDRALNARLKAAGFQVYPRYGWFGGKFKVGEGNQQWAAIGADGQASTKDFCPLAILEQAADQELGRYFAQARELAALPDIDGLCVDFECGAVWCYCDRCLALFTQETGVAAPDRKALAPDGDLEEAYKSFGHRRNRDLLARVRQDMQAVNPKLKYSALASAADMPSYWWDGRYQGRHALRELVKFSDGILVSAYFYKLPGGLKSVRPLIQMTRQYALDAGRDVAVGLISPLASTVSETPRYGDLVMEPPLTRLELLLAGTGGARALSFFRGDCFDGEYYLAIRRAMAELTAMAPYFQRGYDRSFELDLRADPAFVPRFDLDIPEHLLARMPWRPSVVYGYDACQFTRDHLGKDRLILVYNYNNAPLPVTLGLRGLYDERYTLSDWATGAKLGDYDRVTLADGQLRLTVPAQDCLILRLVTVE